MSPEVSIKERRENGAACFHQKRKHTGEDVSLVDSVSGNTRKEIDSFEDRRQEQSDKSATGILSVRARLQKYMKKTTSGQHYENKNTNNRQDETGRFKTLYIATRRRRVQILRPDYVTIAGLQSR